MDLDGRNAVRLVRLASFDRVWVFASGPICTADGDGRTALLLKMKVASVPTKAGASAASRQAATVRARYSRMESPHRMVD